MCRTGLPDRKCCRYFDPVSKPEWTARLAECIGAEVRRHRTDRGWSVRELSEAVEKQGVALAPPVLSNLELGRRGTVSSAEIRALAAALGVPPLLLEYPMGVVEQIEPLPGVRTSPWEAFRWASGEEPLPGHPDLLRDKKAREVIERFREHQLSVDLVLGFREDARECLAEAEQATDPETKNRLTAEAGKAEENADRRVSVLRRQRASMRREGLTPPSLPPRLRGVDRSN